MRKAQVFKYWERVRSSFWFLPAAMAAGAIGLAFTTVALDEPATEWLRGALGWTFEGGAEGASAVLGTIAGSMITIAGVVFSMTLVALSLTSSQLGPRLLRNFMRDTATQMVLGTFVATFLYCLLVLRTIRRVEEVVFVPHLSVTFGVGLAVVSLGVLIYFIHHVSLSIQANEIVSKVARELMEGVDRIFPEHIGRGAPRAAPDPPDAAVLDTLDREAHPIGAAGDGYLQYIDGEALMELAMQEDLIFRLERRPGQYVVAGRPLVMVWPGDRADDELTERVNSALVLGHQRNPSQDVAFAINQLVEIALRALSPGLNDPFTAVACVDRLGSALCRLARRDAPSRYRYDKHDKVRVIASAVTFAEVTNCAFDQIRQHGRSNVAVTLRLLETIATVASAARRPEDRVALMRQAEMIVRGARDALSEAEDLRVVEDRFHAARRLLEPLRVREVDS